jgi:hypothetical protein
MLILQKHQKEKDQGLTKMTSTWVLDFVNWQCTGQVSRTLCQKH